jgi:CRP-like cAMP-binding protein
MSRYDADRALGVLVKVLEGVVPPETLRRLESENLPKLARAMEFHTFADGRCFIEQGSLAPDGVYFVLSGRVRIHSKPPKLPGTHARERPFHVDRVVTPPLDAAGEPSPWILGLVRLVDAGPRTASCTAVGPVHVAYLPRQAALMEMDAAPEVRTAFRYLLAQQLVADCRALNARLEQEIQARA